MATSQRKRFRPAFYDIIPAGQTLTPELSPFPGSLRQDDLYVGQRLKVTVTPRSGIWNGPQETLCTVTDAPHQDHLGQWQVELVFDEHVERNHPDLEPGKYKNCCYRDIKLSSLGIMPDADGSWNQQTFSVTFRETE